jgi:hypothetical protein
METLPGNRLEDGHFRPRRQAFFPAAAKNH